MTYQEVLVVICLKIRTFVVSATTQKDNVVPTTGCDLLENSYLCGISNNKFRMTLTVYLVVICLKIRTFVVSATTKILFQRGEAKLWFAWKFVPLWYQQQLYDIKGVTKACCDLLENSYLCGISNNRGVEFYFFALLWFAWKFVPLWYQQQQHSLNGTSGDSCDLLENSYLCGISNNWSFSIFVPVMVVICLKIRTFVVSATTLH